MMQRSQSPQAVLATIEKELQSARTKDPAQVLDAIVSALSEGRSYYWVGAYLTAGEFATEQVATRGGAAPATISVAHVNSEIAVPIRLGARKLGLIVAETGRPVGNCRQERALLQQTAKMIAEYLTHDRAKGLLRKMREQGRSRGTEPSHKSPQAARPALRRAAAGEHANG
jgi:putative methionine-R-sulfoxide reductase with GAF domain